MASLNLDCHNCCILQRVNCRKLHSGTKIQDWSEDVTKEAEGACSHQIDICHWGEEGLGFLKDSYVEGFEIYMKLCTTIPTHQGVGILETTPKDSMYDSSSFAFTGKMCNFTIFTVS